MPLSYLITSMTPSPFAEKIWEMKKHFNRFEKQEKTQENSVITLNEAHITLKRRFYLKDPSLEDEVVKSLAKIKFDPIKISVTSTDIFPSETMNNVLIGRVSEPVQLAALHQNILETIFPFTTPESLTETHSFNPHISLIYDLADADIEKAKEYAIEHIFPMDFELSDFLLLRNIEGVSKERVILSTIQA